MENMSHKYNYIAIMDDLLVHSKKENHLDRIIDLLRALIKHGLKFSPKNVNSSGVSLHGKCVQSTTRSPEALCRAVIFYVLYFYIYIFFLLYFYKSSTSMAFT